MLTAACTHSIQVRLKIRVVIVFDHFHESLHGFLHWLAVVPEASLQPHRVFARPKHGNHEGRRAFRAVGELRDTVLPHGVTVKPENVSHALNLARRRVIRKVPDKEAAALRLNMPVVALGAAGRRAARRANCGRFLACQLVAARASGLLPVEQCPVPSVEFVVQLISGRLHGVEHIEAPIVLMVAGDVVGRAQVAHAQPTGVAILQSLDVRHLVLIVQLTCRDVVRC